MPPRKSTASVATTLPNSPNDTSTVDISLLSPSSTTAATTLGEPKSPPPKGQRQSTSAAPENDGEKPDKQKKPNTTPRANEDIGIDDLLLPRTLTSRLSRGTLPPNTSIQRDALLALTKSATVFISYLAHTANGLTSRKTIQSQDILDALREAELWNVVVPGQKGTLGDKVRAEVEKWEGEVRGKRKGYRERIKARESGGVVDGEDEEGRGLGPSAKRARRESLDEELDGDVSLGVGGDGEDEDPAAMQLRGEEAAANGDATDTDREGEGEEEEDEDDAVDEDEEDEVDQDEADEEEDARRRRLDAEDDTGRRKTALSLAPNGRVEVGSDDDDESD